MNKQELIESLISKFYAVNEAGLHEGNTEAGITVWGIGVFDKTGDVIAKRNLTFYTMGDENAFWGVSEPKPTIPEPDPTFTDRVNIFIASKIEDATIKFGYINQIEENTLKALGIAIMPDNIEKNIIVSEDAVGNFSIDVL